MQFKKIKGLLFILSLIHSYEIQEKENSGSAITESVWMYAETGGRERLQRGMECRRG